MSSGVDDQQPLGVGIALAGAGSLLAVSPSVAPVPQRPALYAGTVLVVTGVLVVLLGRLSG
ncbi:MAG: hypothetical protein ABEJ88_00055 [Halobacterium sp.]